MRARPDEPPLALPALAEERALALLATPEMPAHAAADVALARRAAEAMVPLLLTAAAAERPLLIARALHKVAHRAGPVWLCRGTLPATPPHGATLVVPIEPNETIPTAVLEALLDEPAAWIVVVCDDASLLPASIGARLGAAVLHVPALAERGDEVAAVASAALARLAERAGEPPPTLATGALAALAAHRWPGGRVELERVLARALLLAGPGGSIEAEVLDLTPAPPPATTAADPCAPEAAGPRLEYLLAELAHELRNPLVTVKTFAQQLPALLEDEALRTRFAELTDDAVDRMDGLLENVLAFARLRAPRPEALDVAALLDGVLGEVAPALDEREVRVRRIGRGARCAADREHLRYALSNLLLGIAHETPPRAELVVDASVNGVVSLRFGTGATITRLRDLAGPAAGAALDDPTFLPLAFTLARAVLERTGAALGIVPDPGGHATVTVRLPHAAPPAPESRGDDT